MFRVTLPTVSVTVCVHYLRSYQERLRTVDPIWNQKYDTKPLGAVPDFDMLHM